MTSDVDFSPAWVYQISTITVKRTYGSADWNPDSRARMLPGAITWSDLFETGLKVCRHMRTPPTKNFWGCSTKSRHGLRLALKPRVWDNLMRELRRDPELDHT